MISSKWIPLADISIKYPCKAMHVNLENARETQFYNLMSMCAHALWVYVHWIGCGHIYDLKRTHLNNYFHEYRIFQCLGNIILQLLYWQADYIISSCDFSQNEFLEVENFRYQWKYFIFSIIHMDTYMHIYASTHKVISHYMDHTCTCMHLHLVISHYMYHMYTCMHLYIE